MRKRKLQVFLSSTYEDLVDHRLAAMEAILAAGHIPAAMEQFSAGDETAWEKIKLWIDESDAFILILGGRYGSIEPKSGKSYVQLEYEYAIEKKKPFFALVVTDKHHAKRVQKIGLHVDERENPELYKKFKKTVTERLCGFWNDRKDIKSAIFQKLPEWAQREDLGGWVRGDEATSAAVSNELARLSHENRELRMRTMSSTQTFVGLTFDDLVGLLGDRTLSAEEAKAVVRKIRGQGDRKIGSLLQAFGELFRGTQTVGGDPDLSGILDELSLHGLVEKHGVSIQQGRPVYSGTLTGDGVRFRNSLLLRDRKLQRRAENAEPTGST